MITSDIFVQLWISTIILVKCFYNLILFIVKIYFSSVEVKLVKILILVIRETVDFCALKNTKIVKIQQSVDNEINSMKIFIISYQRQNVIEIWGEGARANWWAQIKFLKIFYGKNF